MTKAAPNIINYNVDGQILNDLNGVSAFGHSAPLPVGANIPVPAVDANGNLLHLQIPPKVPANRWNPKQDYVYAQKEIAYEKAKYDEEINRHLMSSVKDGIEKQKADDSAVIGEALKL